MKTTSAYKSLCPDERQSLSDAAKDVAMLVGTAETMDYFRKQLREFAGKWEAYKTADDANRKGEWQASMGKPGNPIDAIWPRFTGGMRLPSYSSVSPVLGAYALLAVIHDEVLPNCPPITTGVLPKELASRIWRDLVTGANVEGSLTGTPKRVIPTTKIESFLWHVKGDIEDHLSSKAKAHRQPVDSEAEGERSCQELFGDLFDSHSRNTRWLAEVSLPAPKTFDEMWAIRDEYNIPERAIDNALEISDMTYSLTALDDVLIAAIKNGRKTTAGGKADAKEQRWEDDAAEYLPLKQARKLIDNRLSMPTLSKLCKPDGDMRYMRKSGVGCKVHIADFRRHMQG